MKYLIPIFFLVQSLNVANAQNEQLIRDIENYITKIDSLMNCCISRCFTMEIGCGYDISASFFGIFSPVNMLDSILCDENSARNFVGLEGVIHQPALIESRFFSRRSVVKEYYKAGELVAVINKRTFREQRETVAILYINNGKVIYHRGLPKDVGSLMQRHNLQFYQTDCRSSPQ